MTESFLDFAARLRSTPWAVSASGLATLRALADSGPGSARAARPAPPRRATKSGVAVIPIVGFIDQRPGVFEAFGIGTSCDTVAASLRQALNDETVGRIVFDIDSPGGSVAGVIELADEIYAARAKKPIIAVANSLAASAAYWIGCSATKLYVTPGGEVGSIGVWMAHEDVSEAMAAAGVDVTLISAGKYKTEANPFGPLDAEARAFLQSRTDDYYAAFTKAVARGRGVPIDAVRSGMGQGRVLGATQAMAEKMVDGVMPFGEVLRGGSGAARAGLVAHTLRPGVARALRELDRLA